MARTRKSSKDTLNEKIEKAQADVVAAKKRYDEMKALLKQLLDKRDAMRKEELAAAVAKSNRTYEEIMVFLNTDNSGSQDS